jgi:erythromycin esterase-like protein
LGFDAIGWEAGTYNCSMMSRALENGVEPAIALQQGLYGVWHSAETLSLIMYISQRQHTGRPVEHFGFDCQNSSVIGALTAGKYLATCAAQIDPKRDFGELERLVTLFHRSVRDKAQLLSQSDEEKLLLQLDDLAALLARDETGAVAALGQEAAWVAETTIANLLVQVPRIRYMHTYMDAVLNSPEERRWAREQEAERVGKAREAAMAANVLSWRRRNPGRRLVCWMANLHASRNAATDVGREFKGWQMLGDHLWQAEGQGCYSVGFMAYGGSTRTWDGQVRPLRDRPPGSVEHRLHELGREFGFIDLRSLGFDHWLHEPRKCFPVSEDKTRPVQLPRLFDGVFFIDEMRPTTPLIACDG